MYYPKTCRQTAHIFWLRELFKKDYPVPQAWVNEMGYFVQFRDTADGQRDRESFRQRFEGTPVKAFTIRFSTPLPGQGLSENNLLSTSLGLNLIRITGPSETVKDRASPSLTVQSNSGPSSVEKSLESVSKRLDIPPMDTRSQLTPNQVQVTSLHTVHATISDVSKMESAKNLTKAVSTSDPTNSTSPAEPKSSTNARQSSSEHKSSTSGLGSFNDYTEPTPLSSSSKCDSTNVAGFDSTIDFNLDDCSPDDFDLSAFTVPCIFIKPTGKSSSIVDDALIKECWKPMALPEQDIHAVQSSHQMITTTISVRQILHFKMTI
ncbi:MAG: hypothetical protein Q9164_000499 [Protoblastenia rupestris]